MKNITRVTKAKLFFAWFDLWIGVYVDRSNTAVYICPIPMFGIKVWREDVPCCPVCGKPVDTTMYKHNMHPECYAQGRG